LHDLSPLKPIFKSTKLKKIFHGADYDVRSLYRDFKVIINNLFDTQIACRFLGFAETGLEAVLRNKFDIGLDKRYQRKDWSKRPLPEEMIAYATNDARYLVPLANDLEADLEKKGRLTWVFEECELLSNVRPAANNNCPLFLNFRGAGKLAPGNLAVLEEILQYRKRIARKKDRPLFRIMGQNSLLKLTEIKPVNMKQLEKSNALSQKQIVMYGRDVIAAITRAMKIQQGNFPVYPRRKAPVIPAAVAGLVKALRIWRDKRANELDIDPALICTKALISAIAVQKPQSLANLGKISEMKNWQRTEFGRDILNVLEQARVSSK
jgi:ribonuclease D